MAGSDSGNLQSCYLLYVASPSSFGFWCHWLPTGSSCPSLDRYVNNSLSFHYLINHLLIDTITYFCSIVGILQAGFTVFPISPRNGAAAVAHLLKRTQTACIFTSEEPRIIELATAALAQLPSKHESVKILAMPVFEDLFPSTTETEPVKAVFCWRYPSDVPMIILHSSGM